MTLTYLTPLPAPVLRDFGIPEPWAFGIANRVRFSELDALGHVNNAAYLSWFENLRLPYLKAMNVTDYGEGAPRLVLAEVGCSYRAEMKLGHDYIVTGRTRSLKTSSFTMDYAVWRVTDAAPVLSAEAHAVIALRTPDGASKHLIPEAGRAALIAEGAEG